MFCAQRWASGGCQLTLWLWEVLRDLIRSRSGLGWTWAIWGSQRYHPSATSPGSNGSPQTGMFVHVCIPHAHLLFFYVRISAGSTVSGLTNGFSNPLVCWKFFQPPVLKPRPKMYLNTSIPVDSCLSVQPPHPLSTGCYCVFWLAKMFPLQRERDAGRKGEGHQESSNNEMSSRADHNC